MVPKGKGVDFVLYFDVCHVCVKVLYSVPALSVATHHGFKKRRIALTFGVISTIIFAISIPKRAIVSLPGTITGKPISSDIYADCIKEEWNNYCTI